MLGTSEATQIVSSIILSCSRFGVSVRTLVPTPLFAEQFFVRMFGVSVRTLMPTPREQQKLGRLLSIEEDGRRSALMFRDWKGAVKLENKARRDSEGE